MKKKRWLAGLILAAVFAFGLVGCDDSDSALDADANADQVVEPEKSGVEVTGYVVDSPVAGAKLRYFVHDEMGVEITSGDTITNADGYFGITLSKEHYDKAVFITARATGGTMDDQPFEGTLEATMERMDYEQVGELNVTPMTTAHHKLWQLYQDEGMDAPSGYRRAKMQLAPFAGQFEAGEEYPGVSKNGQNPPNFLIGFLPRIKLLKPHNVGQLSQFLRGQKVGNSLWPI